MAECIKCGKAIADTTKTHRCKACGQREAAIAKGMRVVEVSECKQCGKSFLPKASNRTTCCSRECGFKWSLNPANPREIERAEKRDEKDRLRPFAMRDCIVCGEMFIVARNKPATKTCGSDWCKRVLKGAYTKVEYHGGAVHQFIAEIASRTCRVCGDAIEQEAEFNAKDCSECRGIVSRQTRDNRLKNAFVEAVSRKKVFDRDKWTCMLCGKKVPRDKEAPHAMSAVVDHIVPLARGGTHEYKNVQCAHYGCNAKKSANMIGQLRLFG